MLDISKEISYNTDACNISSISNQPENPYYANNKGSLLITASNSQVFLFGKDFNIHGIISRQVFLLWS